MSSNPFFSICIPTRNRPETLEYCLKTLLEQDLEDYEIIISDNSDGSQTKALIETIPSSKIKYYQQTTVLSMVDNFEFVIKQATGEYVICIGDDDGLVLNSLGYLKNFIDKYNAKVVKCCGILYYWKDSLMTKESSLIYPKANPVKEIVAMSALQKVLDAELDYFHLPMIYYGAIHKSVLKKLIDIQGSVFADAGAVDIYSGLCIAFVEDRYFVSDLPFTIAGNSGKSNGSGFVQKKATSNEFFALDKVQSKYTKLNIPELYEKLESVTWLCLQQFINNFKVSEKEFKINKTKWLLRINSTKEILQEGFINIKTRQAFLKANYTNEWVEESLKMFNFFPCYFPVGICLGASFFDNHIKINHALFGINNVYDASKVCFNLQQASLQIKPIAVSKKNIKEWRFLNKKRKVKEMLLFLLGKG